MSTIEIGTKLVALCRDGKGMDALDTLYDEKIISLEAEGGGDLPARMQGLDAIRKKNEWWYENHEVHESKASGPFRGQREDQFAVYFEIDVTFKPTRERRKLDEIGLYTVAEGKIVAEEFWGRPS